MTPERFDDLVQPYRRELAAYCYRMLGSLADAEDQVQETLLSAWRGIDGFEGRASLRTWLYRIATHRCLDAIRSRPRRGMPADHGAPADPEAPLVEHSELPWVDPAPPALWDAVPASPESQFSSRESVQLAFVVALQHLPATQRAALILREVVGWSAHEVAALLDTTVAAVNSALQRARATLDEKRLLPDAVPRAAASTRALAARFIAAWETGDLDALIALLHEDVIASMPPLPAWFRGRDAFAAFLATRMAVCGALRLVQIGGPEHAGELMFAVYRRLADATAYEARAIQIVRVAGGAISEFHKFFDVSLFPRFGLPLTIDR